VLADGEEMPADDRKEAVAADIGDECATMGATPKKKEPNYVKECTDEFVNLDKDQQKDAKSFKYKFGPGDGDAILWTILAEDEQITVDAMKDDVKKLSPFKKDIPWNPDQSQVEYYKILFEHFLPCLEGKAALLICRRYVEKKRLMFSGCAQNVICISAS
jgi:hypothetical protein